MEDRKTLLINWSIEQHTEAKNIKDDFVKETGEKISWDSFVFHTIQNFGDDKYTFEGEQELKPDTTISKEEMEKLIGDGNYN